jgi:hypothetical protein
MKQLARAEYLLRHLGTFAPYVTATKLYNLALNLIELRLKITHPKACRRTSRSSPRRCVRWHVRVARTATAS